MNQGILIASVLLIVGFVVGLSILGPTAAISITYGTATASSATVINASIQESNSITGLPITTSGYVYRVVENPQCYPQCLAPSFLLTYLYVPPGVGCTGYMACYPPPRHYRLLNTESNPLWATVPNGTYVASVTGMLIIPSSWSCDSFYVPKICLSGDIYVQALTIPEFPNWILTSISLLLAFAVVKFSNNSKSLRERAYLSAIRNIYHGNASTFEITCPSENAYV